MVVNKSCIWIVLLMSLLFNTVYAQDFEITLGSSTICEGSTIQVDLTLDTATPSFFYNWTLQHDGGNEVALRDNDQDPGTGSGQGDDFTFFRTSILEPGENIIRVTTQGNVDESITITVIEAPIAGLGGTVFLCNKTGTLNLFDEIDGGANTGGVWTYVDQTDGLTKIDADGLFDIDGGDEPNIFTYTVAGVSPCPNSDTTVIVRACSDDDFDDDNVLNTDDLDDDNDGILNIDENSFCTVAELTPTQNSLDEDFGIGPPTQNSNINPRLTYQIGVPQDTSGNGEYNVATSTYLFSADGYDAIFVATELINNEDGDGNVDGRYLAINMTTASFQESNDEAVIYEQEDLPVTAGVLHTLSMKVSNLNGDQPGQIQPSLKLEIIDNSGVVIETVLTGEIPSNNDEWEEFEIEFTPLAGVDIVTLRVSNQQTMSGNGNDLGIDNILLARLECDFDGDGVPNYLDRDSDNDGIFDAVEAGFDESEVQADGQLIGGVDTDGVPTIANGGVSLTNDNYLNLDSDGDGCSDANEAYFDAEADGTLLSTNVIETQVYGEDPFDFADIVDFDGLVIEATYTFPVDNDGDSVLDYIQAGGPDLNGNSIPDACEDSADHDEDGLPDDVDLDDDNDGILDAIENICTVINTSRTTGDYNVTVFEAASELSNAYSVITGTTNSADVYSIAGLATAGTFTYDEYSGTGNSLSINFSLSTRSELSTDYGVSVSVASEEVALLFEKTLTADEAGVYDIIRNPFINVGSLDRALDNFVIIYLNGSQIYTSEEDAFLKPNGTDVSNLSLAAGDVLEFLVYELDFNDGDPDDSINTVLGYSIGGCDSDNDGIINQFDLDSDNDGIYDYVEAGEALGSGFENGLFSTTTDVDANGVPNAASGGLSVSNVDGDIFYDFLDIDADGDGIPDNFEAQLTIGYLAPSGTDSDENGVDDSYDANGVEINPISTGTGDPDYLNINSDDDCLDDIDEAYDIDQDGVSDIVLAGTDSDNDGLDDAFDTIVLANATSYTNASGNSGLVSTFPNNHIPTTTEVDYREEYLEIVEVVSEPQVLCATEMPFRLFDLIETLTTNESGLWTGGIAAATGEVFDWELDPSLVADGLGEIEYVYTLPIIGTCPESTFTVTINVEAEPFSGLENLTATVCESVPTVLLDDLLLPNGTTLADVGGTWSSTDIADADLQSSVNGTFFDTSLIVSVGDSVTFTYTVGADSCIDSTDVTLTKTSGRNAGTAPVDPIVFCGSDTVSYNLLDYLAGAENDGAWSSTDDTVTDLTVGSLGTIVPSNLPAGVYVYEYFLAATTCEEATTTISIQILQAPDAGTDGVADECSSTVSINLFDFLGGTPQETNSLLEEGVWTDANDQAIGTDHLGVLELENVTTGGVFTYTVGEADCEATAEVIVNITDGPNPGVSVTTPIILCKSDTDPVPDLITYLGADAETGGTWEQEFNSLTSTNNGTIDLSVLDAGEYIFTYTLTGGTGPCAAISATVAVTITPVLIAMLTATDDIVCREVTGSLDLSTYLDASSTIGGTWSGGVITASGILDYTTADANETYVYTVEPTIVGGCDPVSASIDITLSDDRDAGADPAMPIVVCSDSSQDISLFDSLTVTDNDGVWTGVIAGTPVTTTGGFLGTVTPNTLTPGDYTFTYTLPAIGSCAADEVVVSLTVLTAPEFTFAAVPVCTVDRTTYSVGYTTNIVDLTQWDISIEAVVGTDDIGSASIDFTNSEIINVPAGVEITLIVKDNVSVVCDVTFNVPLSECPCIDMLTAPTNLSDVTVCEGDPNTELSVTVADTDLTANWYAQFEDDMDPIRANSTTFTSPETNVGGYTYWVKTYNPISDCESEDFVEVEFTIFGLPEVVLPTQEFVCTDDAGVTLPGTFVTIDSELSELNYTFEWFNSTGATGDTTASIDVTLADTYYVEFTSTNGATCVESSSSIVITPIMEPVIESLTLGGSGGFAEFNTIIATLENGGDVNGEYEYDLDGSIFQESNIFENVSTGLHTVTVTDLNGCGTHSAEIYVIGFPKFFTPNDDGSNDSWNVDLDPSMPMDLNIFVFDRFGKLIQQVFPTKTGWDGTFAGKNMPSDDYWFIATLNETGETFASHFSLIR